MEMPVGCSTLQKILGDKHKKIEKDAWEELRPDTVLLATYGLYFSRRGEYCLVIEPNTATYMRILASDLRYLNLMERPITYKELLAATPEVPEEEMKQFLEFLYLNQMISLDHHRYYDDKMWDQKQGLAHFHVLRVTQRCNFNCAYCYANCSTNAPDMTLDTLKRIIEKVVAEIPSPRFTFEFHGGEPLLMFDMLIEGAKFGYEIMRKYGKKIQFLLQTNGSLLTDERCRILSDNFIGVGVSLDGTPRIHDKYRTYYDGRGTYEDAWRGYSIAKKYLCGAGVLADLQDPEDYPEAFEHLTGEGVPTMALKTTFACIKSIKEGLRCLPERQVPLFAGYIYGFERVAEINEEAGRNKVDVREVNQILSNIVHKDRRVMCLRTPCGAINSVTGIDVHGNIYPCDEFSGVSEWKIGNVRDPRPLNKLMMESPVTKMFFGRHPSKMTRCAPCAWRFFCNGACPTSAYNLHKKIYRGDELCGFFSRIFEEFLWRLMEDPKRLKYYTDHTGVILEKNMPSDFVS
ncbi:MAG: radical SAM protein [bacterium]